MLSITLFTYTCTLWFVCTQETCAVALVIIINYDDEQYYELTYENDVPKPELKY